MPTFDSFDDAKEYLEEALAEARAAVLAAKKLDCDESEMADLREMVDEWCSLLQEEASGL